MDMNATTRNHTMSLEAIVAIFTSTTMNTLDTNDPNSTFANLTSNNPLSSKSTINTDVTNVQLTRLIFHGILLVIIGKIGVVGKHSVEIQQFSYHSDIT